MGFFCREGGAFWGLEEGVFVWVLFIECDLGMEDIFGKIDLLEVAIYVYYCWLYKFVGRGFLNNGMEDFGVFILEKNICFGV